MKSGAFILFFGLLMAWSARADAIYTFTGYPFYDTTGNVTVPTVTCEDPSDCTSTIGLTSADSISGSFDLASPVPADFDSQVNPVSWSFTDGLTTITNANALYSYFGLTTAFDGTIFDWNIAFGAKTPLYDVDFVLSGDGGTGVQYFDLDGNPLVGAADPFGGSWVVTIQSVPEPVSFTLVSMGIGLASFVGCRRVGLASRSSNTPS